MSTKHTHKILIVDDELDIAELCREVFEELGYKVFLAYSGKDGIKIFRDESIDVVLSDANMPLMTGLDMFTKMQEMDKGSPLLYLVTGSVSVDEDQVKKIGIKRVMLKPFDINSFAEIVDTDVKETFGE